MSLPRKRPDEDVVEMIDEVMVPLLCPRTD
jgi:hypothetical protein